MSKHDFTTEEFAARLARVRAAIADASLDWMVLFHPVSIHWLTGSDAKSYQAFQCLLVSADDRPTVMVVRESERAEIEADTIVGRIVTWGGSEPQDPLDVFGRIADELGLVRSRVGMEVPGYYLHPHHYVRLKEVFGPRLAEPTDLVHRLKLVKSPQELQYIRQAAAIADQAMQCFVANLSIGRTELELSGEVYRALQAAGSGLPASTLNLVSGERCGFSHGAPTDRIIAAGDFGNIEFGAARRRYTSTIGRQFAMGRPTARMREIFDVVRAASDACRASIRAGVKAIVPHEAGKAVIAQAGMDRYRIHTSGYGLAPGFPPSWGEPISMFGGTTDVLQAGMVVTIEPPVFIGEEKLGARIIDNVLVTDTGCELLGRFPRDLIVVD